MLAVADHVAVAIGVAAAILLLPAVALFIGFVGLIDYYLEKRWGVDATISRGMERIWKFWPAVAFLMGVVCGLCLGFLAGHFGAPQAPLP